MHRRRRLRRVVLAGLAGLAVIGAAGVVTLEVSDIQVRRLLRIEPIPVACSPSHSSTRVPLGGPAADTWDNGPSLPRAQDEVRAVTVAQRIIVGSGLVPRRGVLGGLASLDYLYSFDPRTGTYEELAPLPVRLDHPAFAAHGHDLYVLGGWTDGIPSGRAFRLAGGSWEELAPMPTPRAGVAAAVVADRIYVIGGSGVKHDGGLLPGTRTVEAFDVATDSWLTLPEMPTPRHHHAATAVGTSITVVGGRDGGLFSIATAEQLDTATGRWTESRPLPLAVGAPTAATVDGRVVVAGGGDDAGGWATPATWMLRGDRWDRLPDLQMGRHGHGMAALGGAVYVFGGSPCGGYGVTDSVERLAVR